MDGGVGNIVEGSNHLLFHFHLCGVVFMAKIDTSGEFLDVTIFYECSVPAVLPIVTSFLVDWATKPFVPSLL